VRIALALALASSVARAEPVTLPNSKAALDVPATWTKVDATGVVYGAKGPTGELVAITRAQVPNPDAWRPKKREAYADLVEKGVSARIKGYKRTSRKIVELNTIPTLDLEAKRDDGATIVLRIFLYRTYALSLAVEVPKKGSLKDARAIAASFTPPPQT
jgi:hypothetical protein